MDVSGNLNGEYYYMIGHSSACGESFGADKIQNGDFETWANDTLTYWDTLNYATGNIDDNTTYYKDGSTSLMLKSDTAGWRYFRQPGIQQWMAIDDDSTYYVESWVYKRGSTGGLLVGVYDESNSLINYGIVYDPDTAFNKISFSFQRKSGDDSVLFKIYIGGYSSYDTAYIDSMTVRNANLRRFAVVTKPVVAQSENVLLTHFPWQTMASGCAFADAAYNTLDLDIYRTKANPGEITPEDNFYLINTISLTDTSQIDTLHFIDTLSDDSFGHGSYTTVINIDTASVGRDSLGVVTGVRVGAPTYVGNTYNGIPPDTAINIFATPIADSEFVNKISYICTYYDTLINAESDSSRSLHVYHNFATDSMYKIGLPPLPGGMDHLTRRIYKSYSYVIGHLEDSISSVQETTIVLWNGYAGNYDGEWRLKNMYEPRRFIENILNNNNDIYIRPDYAPPSTSKDWNTWLSYYLKYYKDTVGTDTIYDTTATPYKLIGEVKGTDSVFVDSIGFDSTRQGKHYWKSEAPYNLNYITSFNDRLWGAVGSCVYWSYLDSGGYWGSFRNICLNIDDGDEITAILPMRDYVKVYKNKSQYAIYPGNDFEYERQWTVDGLGCIAPHTALSYQNGVFYLSEQGLIHETGSVYRDRGSDFGNVSEPINNLLLNRTRDALRKAVGFVHKDKYRLSFPASDTTFVYDLKTGGWSIWNYAFAQACLYDTLTINDKNNTPSGDMIFINGETDQIYKADTTSTDNTLIGGTGGTVINTRFRSAPFAMAPDYMTVSKFGIWRQSNDGSGGVDVRLYNAESDSIFYKYMSSIATRYDIYRSNSDASNYFQIDISDTTLDSLAIDRIDLWLEKIGDQPEN